jgi:hypothetical protein
MIGGYTMNEKKDHLKKWLENDIKLVSKICQEKLEKLDDMNENELLETGKSFSLVSGVLLASDLFMKDDNSAELREAGKEVMKHVCEGFVERGWAFTDKFYFDDIYSILEGSNEKTKRIH